MDSKDLSIGNFIMKNNKHHIITVEDLIELTNRSKIFNPIIITEEELIKLNFSKVNNKSNDIIYYHKLGFHLKLQPTGIWHLEDDFLNFIHVHHLQNYINALMIASENKEFKKGTKVTYKNEFVCEKGIIAKDDENNNTLYIVTNIENWKKYEFYVPHLVPKKHIFLGWK
jgi:hypothetical protein